MLEMKSALATARPYRSNVLKIAERPGFTLTQAAALGPDFESILERVVGPIPEKVGIAAQNANLLVMRIGPAQVWIVGPTADDTASRLKGCALTPLSHGRVRIAMEGAPVRHVMSKLMPLDFHPRAFAPGAFAMTGLHHTPVTIHCTGDDSFDIYALRTFAMNVYEVITDAALEFV